MRLHAASVLSFVLVLSISAVGRAHSSPSSTLMIDLTVDGAQLEQDVPLEELELAMRQQLVRPGEDLRLAVQRARPVLLDYAARHVRARRTSDGAAWQVEVRDVRARSASDGPRVIFDLSMRAPGGGGASFALHDEIVAHEVVSHYTTVLVRSEWSARETASAARLVGTLHAGRNELVIARAGSFFGGFSRVVELGTDHIATGTDHLLFLFALLLVAPLQTTQGRWLPRSTTRASLAQLLRVVSAFTVGHSLTLALGAVDTVRLPAELVEVGIALSVLLAACNALRPIFGGNEARLALAFGLVHGLAFAGTIAEQCLGTAQTLWTLLGFNLGIELAQLVLVALVMPWLLMLARTKIYAPFRQLGASVIAVLAVGWLIERTGSGVNLTAPLAHWLEGHALLLLIALASVSLLARASLQPVRSPVRSEADAPALPARAHSR